MAMEDGQRAESEEDRPAALPIQASGCGPDQRSTAEEEEGIVVELDPVVHLIGAEG
jgi:hypothetical protein